MIMKKTMIIKAIVIALLCVITQWGGISHAGPRGVVGSSHDMSIFITTGDYTGTYTSTGTFRYWTMQVCIFCHTPHGGNMDMRSDTFWDDDGSPDYTIGTDPPILLWNRSLGSAVTSSVTPYTSSSMHAPSDGDLWAYSLMCMSCHDGVTAINVLQRNPSDHGPGPLTSYDSAPTFMGDALLAPNKIPANIGDRIDEFADTVTNLSNDHPVSIDYELAQSNGDGGLENPQALGGGWQYVGNTKVRLFPEPVNGQFVAVECSSCHDVHNEGSDDPGSADDVKFKYPFLNVSIEGSLLCRQCHRK
jgi:hypothetical protein